MEKGAKLGEGTFGIVYSAKLPDSSEEYAVKRNFVEEDISFIGVPRELDLLNKLRDHPYIIVLDTIFFGNPFNDQKCLSPIDQDKHYKQKDDNVHFIFEKADCDLHDLIYQKGSYPGYSRMKSHMIQLLLAVRYIHQNNIIHRDLKPSNILYFNVEEDYISNKGAVKICDFGLSKPFTYQGIQTPKTLTSWYRAPEVALDQQYDYKVDIWCLGLIFFEMIARYSLISDIPDHNDEILSNIIGILPDNLTPDQYKEIKSCKTRNIKLTEASRPRKRKSFLEKLSLTNREKERFEERAGSLEQFCDLLNGMIQYDSKKRLNADQCLDHPFFTKERELISNFDVFQRKDTSHEITIYKGIERVWMSDIVTDIFNNKDNLIWYSDRVIFQAMDIFDRYLISMSGDIDHDLPETEDKGRIHDRYGAELRFMACLYLSVKYFSSLHTPIEYETIVTEEYSTEKAKLVAQKFEEELVRCHLSYKIYRETLYEVADRYGDKLKDTDIMHLVILYSRNFSIEGMTITGVYEYYRANLKKKLRRKKLSPLEIVEILEAPLRSNEKSFGGAAE